MLTIKRLMRLGGVTLLSGSFAFSVSAAQVAEDGKGYKLPERSKLSTLPYASTPFRMRWMLNCDAVPADCLLPTDSLFTPWQDVGAPFDFTPWQPVAKLQTSDFTQSRNYQQTQERYEQKRFVHKETGEYSNDGNPIRHEKVVTRSEDRLVDVSFSEWVNDGPNHSCDDWSPSPSTVPWGDEYTQSRGCLEPETRDRIYVADVGEIAREVERRNVATTEDRQQTGTEDFITKTEADPAPAWQDYGTKTCGDWTPETSTVWDDQTFEQTRDCSIGQERTISYYDYWASNAPRTLNRTERETQVRNFQETQDVSGTKELWSPTTDGFSEWTDSGVASYTSWFPNMNNQTASYTQERTKTQPQTRQRYTREINNRDGEYRNISSKTEYRNVVTDESRTVTVTSTSWEDTTRTNVQNWSPAISTQTNDFTQSRGYTQNQTRDWQHRVGSTLMYTRAENRALTSQMESRTIDVSKGSWSYTSGEKNVSSWSPAAAGQTEDYTQTQTYKRDRARTWTYKSGGSILDQRIENDTESLSRNRTVDVSVSSWSDTTRTGHSSWSPAPSNQTSSFTQTRGYTQNQKRTWRHKVGASTIHTRNQTRAVSNQTESRTVSVKSQGWSYTSDPYDYGSYSPSHGSQTSDYTQSRSYKRDRLRPWTFTAGGSLIHTYNEEWTVTLSQSRNVNVTSSGWTNTTRTSHSSWSPAASTQTSDFNQSRGYTQNQKLVYTHKVDSSTVHTRTITRSQTGQSESRRVDVSAGGWSYTSGGYSYGSYSPSYGSQTSNYTQSRSYKRNRARTWSYVASGSTIHTRTQSDVRNLSQSRTVSVTNTGWRNTSTSGYGSWSPSASSQTSNYSQSRSYTQNQEKTYIHKVGTSTVHTRDVTRSLSGQSQSRSVSVSWSGYSNSGSKSCGSWSPNRSNYFEDENVNQTRSCSTPQSGKYTHKAGSTTIHTRNRSRTHDTTESRSVSGTKAVYPSGEETYCTAWSNDGSVIYGTYSPSPSSRGLSSSDYTQSRTRKQPQDRSCYERRYNAKTSNWDRKSSIRTETRTKSLSNQTRRIDVQANSWFNNGSASYSSWKYHSSTQERRTKSQPRKRYIVHLLNGSEIHRVADRKTDTTYEYRSSATWKYSGYEEYRRYEGSPGSKQTEGGSCSSPGAKGWSSRYALTDDDLTQCGRDDSCTGKILAYNYKMVTCQ